MRVILGLGNPGPAYARTRHNVGFWCIDRLARRLDLSFQRRKVALVAEGSLADQPVVLAKARTFVNRSGDAARYLADRFHIGPADLIVVVDDMDLAPGTLRIRPRGSSGGHHGLDSIIARLGTQDFPRIRIGIGRPSNADGVGHVLGSFAREEAALVNDAVDRAASAVEIVLAEGLDAAMNRFN